MGRVVGDADPYGRFIDGVSGYEKGGPIFRPAGGLFFFGGFGHEGDVAYAV